MKNPYWVDVAVEKHLMEVYHCPLSSSDFPLGVDSSSSVFIFEWNSYIERILLNRLLYKKKIDVIQ